jgi:hypothetical protein
MACTDGTSPVFLVDLVCFVYLVHLVYPVSLVQPNKQDKPNKPIKRDKPDRPNRPNEQDRLADCFSILLEERYDLALQRQTEHQRLTLSEVYV